MRIEWDDNLNTGEKEVDDQHKRLFDLINDLRDSCIEDKYKEKINDILIRLNDYVTHHFNSEEKLMFAKQYPIDKTYDHIQEHKELTRKTWEIISEYEEGRMVTILPLAEFLIEWLRVHIRERDMDIAQWIKVNKIKE